MSALSSVIWTAWQGVTFATNRVEASSQIRNFQQFAYSDFAQSSVATLGGCTAAAQCKTPINLANVSYSWDGSNFLDRATGDATRHAATNVTNFLWYVDDTNSTVVVSLTVTVQGYTESQAFRFYPRVNP
jgi:hypothetical protein